MTTGTLTRFAPPQWRLLTALHGKERQTRPVVSCRALLSQQDAAVEDLLKLEEALLVEGVVPGDTVKLSTINWGVAAHTRAYVSTRITSTGTAIVFGQPEIMVIVSVGRGRYHPTVAETCRSAGASAQFDLLLREMVDFGLIEIFDADGKHVDPAKHRGDIPQTWRLALTRKGRSYLCRA